MNIPLIMGCIFIFSGLIKCQSQNNNKLADQKNTMICDPQQGACELPNRNGALATNQLIDAEQKEIKVIYYTDPICSSCWGIEPQLRKLKLEYGHHMEIEYRMGGLLPDWSYNSGGISKPSDVAHHWDEVSHYYDMPIDGDVWLEDPLHSSYPPSIAFKAIQLQDADKAILFLRTIREMVFLKKQNICKWEYLESAAESVGVDLIKFKEDYNGKAKDLFNADLELARSLGVRGFPTMFFMNASGKKELVYGSKPYADFENALLKVLGSAEKRNYDKAWNSIFAKYNSLTAKEFSVLSETPRKESETLLNDLSVKGVLEKTEVKNGSMYTLNKNKNNNKSTQ